jgi:hypothetical protein
MAYGWVSNRLQVAADDPHVASDLPGLRTRSPTRARGLAYGCPRTTYGWMSNGLLLLLAACRKVSGLDSLEASRPTDTDTAHESNMHDTRSKRRAFCIGIALAILTSI